MNSEPAGSEFTTIYFAKNIDVAVTEGEAFFYQALILSAAFLALSGLVLFLLLRSRLRPLGDAIEVLDDLAKGNLEAQIEKKRDDEIGKIADALNVFKARIHAFNTLQLQSVKCMYSRFEYVQRIGYFTNLVVTLFFYLRFQIAFR